MKENVIIVSHKNIRFPDYRGYQPIQVGNDPYDFPNYIRDNKGENISNKNSNYCELTAQYWLWKNDSSDIKGLVHYRRFFLNNHFSISKKSKINNILTEENIEKVLNDFDIILPKKRNYFIETNFSHYIHAHHKEGLDVTEKVIRTSFPEYLEAYNNIMYRRKAHMFNMFISKRGIFDSYSEWLFDVLSEVEKELDITGWDKSESRVFGYISELLLDVWLEKNEIYNVKEVKVGFLGNQKWVKKIIMFVYRKFKK